ncbi:diguanylate cyclase [candidate division TA06 bacterium]|nr:diguanylate cyclase [candidate division TA06 bacterium]
MTRGKEKKRLEEIAFIDDLTGLFNRRYFYERLLEEKRKVDSRSSEPTDGFALMMIDLDNLKPINDLYGHLAGDRVLAQVGKLLKESVRSSDILCRYAGDEFVVILPETREEEVIRVAERMKENFASTSWKDEKGDPLQPVTCSLGYAFYQEKGRDLDGLIHWADQALYAVKRRGGNGYSGEKALLKESLGSPLFSTPKLVGRTKELRRFKSLLEAFSAAGDRKEGGRLILIHGEAGIGKTRLVREIRQVLESRGGTVLLGGCHEETQTIPYYPFREAFKHLFKERKDQTFQILENLQDHFRREIARILPGLIEIEPSELERTPDPYRLFEAVRLLLQSLSKVGAEGLPESGHTPLLFIIEDIHWSDEASLNLLHFLTRDLGEERIIFCGTYRTEEAEREQGPSLSRFVGSLRREKLLEEIPLEPLSARGVSAMLRLLCPGVKVPQDYQDMIYQKTEGNPFYVEEYLRFLHEETAGGGLQNLEEGISEMREVPQSIQALIQRRIDSLAPEMKEALACAALLGKEFEFEILQKVLNRSEVEILEVVEVGMRSHIVRESFEGGGDRYRFVHAQLLLQQLTSTAPSSLSGRYLRLGGGRSRFLRRELMRSI